MSHLHFILHSILHFPSIWSLFYLHSSSIFAPFYYALNESKMSSVRILTNTNFFSSFFSPFSLPFLSFLSCGCARTSTDKHSREIRPLLATVPATHRHQQPPGGKPKSRGPSPSPETYEFRWARIAIRASFPTRFRRRATSDREVAVPLGYSR